MEYFEQIYRSLFRDIYLYLLKLTHDENLAEELTAETFFRALHHLDSFRGDSNIKSYLIQIGKNAFFDYLREQKKFSNEEIGELVSKEQVDDLIIEEETRNLLHWAITQLPTTDQNIIIWRSFDGLSFEKIGEFYQRTANWACVRYHRAKKKLKEILDRNAAQEWDEEESNE